MNDILVINKDKYETAYLIMQLYTLRLSILSF
jgi:hypothetical protein